MNGYGLTIARLTPPSEGWRKEKPPPTWQGHLEDTEQQLGLLKRAMLRLVTFLEGGKR